MHEIPVIDIEGFLAGERHDRRAVVNRLLARLPADRRPRYRTARWTQFCAMASCTPKAVKQGYVSQGYPYRPGFHMNRDSRDASARSGSAIRISTTAPTRSPEVPPEARRLLLPEHLARGRWLPRGGDRAVHHHQRARGPAHAARRRGSRPRRLVVRHHARAERLHLRHQPHLTAASATSRGAAGRSCCSPSIDGNALTVITSQGTCSACRSSPSSRRTPWIPVSSWTVRS